MRYSAKYSEQTTVSIVVSHDKELKYEETIYIPQVAKLAIPEIISTYLYK